MSNPLPQSPRAGAGVGRWSAVLLLLPIAASYLSMAGAGFRSEDFLLLRVLGEVPPWRSVGELVSGPWLGIDVVLFYRPLGEVLLALERAAFGIEPLAYELLHLALFMGCVLLVRGIARRTGAAAGPGVAAERATVAALLFGLYPWHPNAVTWIASYANLFGNLLALAALRVWIGGTGRGRGAGALALYAAALLCYEGVVVVPALVLGAELFLARASLARLVRVGAVWAAPTLAFLGLRSMAVGSVVGGYPEYGSIYASASRLLASLASTTVRLPWPSWAVELPLGARLLVLTAALGSSVLAALRWQRGSDGAGRILFAVTWILAALAPWGFRTVHPGEGRFFFLASVGVALLLAEAVPARQWSTGGRPSLRSVVALPVLVAVAAGWWALLASLLVDLDRAAARAATVVDRVARDVELWGGPEPIFVADVPDSVRRGPVHVQSVLKYGFRDALGPPFHAPRIDAYRLPPSRWTDSSALESFGRLRRWHSGRVATLARRRPLDPLRVVSGIEGRIPPGTSLRIEVEAPPDRWDRYRLFLVTPGNPWWTEAGADEGDTMELDGRMVRSMARLYPGAAHYWWVEALDGKGRPAATSPAFRFWPPESPGTIDDAPSGGRLPATGGTT